jgi:RNA polymerase sigma-70 factor (ECF subfamily)
MIQVRNGSAAAFEELMLRYQSRLLTVLQHLVGQRDVAEDLAQEVFLRVYRSRKRYVPQARFSTWLFTIANHVASNARRGLSRRREFNLPENDGDSEGHGGIEQLVLAGSGAMPARLMDKAEIRSIVQIAIGTLSERQRMAILLSKFESLSYAEIAQVMDLTPQAVKSLLARAREKLRGVLQPYLELGTQPKVPR